TAHPTARVTFTVKRRGGLLAKRYFEVADGVVTSPGPVTVDARAGDDLFFDFSTLDDQRDPRHTVTLRQVLSAATVTVASGGNAPVQAPSAFHGTAEDAAFAQPYRGWAAIGYNGNARATLPIVQADLVVDEHFADQVPSTVDPQAQKDAFAADPRVS